jgi:LysM repeat protein
MKRQRNGAKPMIRLPDYPELGPRQAPRTPPVTDQQDRAALASARTRLLAADVRLRRELADDADHATWSARYGKGMQAVRTEAGDLIRNPADRARFEQTAALDQQRGAAELARSARQLRFNEDLASLHDTALIASDEATRVAVIDTASEMFDAALANGDLSPESAGQHRQDWVRDYVDKRNELARPVDNGSAHPQAAFWPKATAQDAAVGGGSDREAGPVAPDDVEADIIVSRKQIGSNSTYTLSPGENPWVISQKLGVPVERILEENDLDERSAKKLQPGRVLKVPDYMVVDGEDLGSLADRLGMKADDLLATNPELGRTAADGQIIRFNGGQSDSNTDVGTEGVITGIGRAQIGSGAWRTDVPWTDPFNGKTYGAKKNKCFLFVAYVLSRAGAGPDRSLTGLRKEEGEKGRPPNASEWADSDFQIPGWQILAPGQTPEPGDIAAQEGDFDGATGHVVIIGPRNSDGLLTIIGTSGDGTVQTKPLPRTLVGPDNVAGPIVYRRWVGSKNQ